MFSVSFNTLPYMQSQQIVTSQQIIQFLSFVDSARSQITRSIMSSITRVAGLLSSITSVTIAEGVNSIDANAFEEWSELSSVTLSDSVTTIGSYALDWCY